MRLHTHGSSNPLGISSNPDKLPMHPYFIFKDLVTILLFFLALAIIVFYLPNTLGHSDNYIPANPMQTPPSIVPEWYLLPYYAILRSIPSKLIGVIRILRSLLVLLLMPILDTSRVRGSQFRPLMRFAFWMFVTDFFLLMYLGSCHAEEPYITIRAFATAFYFGWFFIIVPLIGIVENTLMDIATDTSSTYSNSNPRSGYKLGTRNYSTSTKVQNVSNINLSLLEARANLKKSMSTFVIPTWVDLNTFKQLANGLFQAEGHISCRIIKKKYFAPVLIINQNFTESSQNFFLILWHVLGRRRNLHITRSSSGKLVIVFRSEDWEYILNTLKNYFNLCYGEKYQAFKKLELIFKAIQLKDKASLRFATYLIYTLAESGKSRHLSLTEQLSVIDLPALNPTFPNFTENSTPLSIPFLIGFIIGDGSIIVNLRKVSEKSIWIVPMVVLPQKYTSHNVIFLNNIKIFLSSLNINSRVRRSIGLIKLEIEGIENVFFKFVPVCAPYCNYFLWKEPVFKMFLKISALVKANVHCTFYGMTVIINILFELSTNRTRSLSYWLDTIESYFKAKGNESTSSEYIILVASGERKGQEQGKHIAWKVSFSIKCKKYDPKGHLQDKQYRFYNDTDKKEALIKAIVYRDTKLRLWVNSVLENYIILKNIDK
jgi:ubiquinol-cytochrome c reductase cytochrome b subunit